MRKLLFFILTSLITIPAFAQKDAFAGFYKGTIVRTDGAKLSGYPVDHYDEFFAEVYRGPKSIYRLKILPAIMSRAESFMTAENLKASGDKIPFDAVGTIAVKGEITADKIVGTGKYRGKEIKLDFNRYNYKAPNLGLKAPQNAVVLFDGTNPSKEWEIVADRSIPVNWTVKDGVMTVKTDAKRPDGKRLSTTIESKRAFGKCRLHLEFNIAPMYEELSQMRSNSGVFFGPYEIQVLDSFGTDALWNECGSLYRQTPPQFNANLEPGAWQVYDIYYTPAQFDGDKLVADACFTVYLNGKRVQTETPVPFSTSMAFKNRDKFQHPKTPVKLQLQDHRNSISFRNIWVVEM